MNISVELALLRTRIGRALWLSAFFLLVATTVVANAGDYTYATNSDDTLTITKYTGSGREVVIPDEIDGRTVTRIGYMAFGHVNWWNDSRVASVTIPDSVTCIGDSAFANCALTRVMIGNGVTSIGGYAFYNCFGLKAITVGEDNPAYSSMDGVLFNKSQTVLMEYPADKGGSYTIPNGVKKIGNYAFNDTQFGGIGPTRVMIPDSVTSIGDGAFWGACLTNITIGNGVTVIGNEAFYLCTILKRVVIPKSVLHIMSMAFCDCRSLESVVIPDSVVSIGIMAFYDCNILNSVTVGKSVARIGDEAFAWCDALTQIYFKGNAPDIGGGIFSRDDNLTVYYMPGTIGWGQTFGDRPAMPLWNGPLITANDRVGEVHLNSGDALKITVAINAGGYAGVPIDWWVVGTAGSSWNYYLNNSFQWSQFDGDFSNCHPVYQGPLINLPATVLSTITDLPIGSYTFWFAVEYPMDGILNVDGHIMVDSVNVTVQ